MATFKNTLPLGERVTVSFESVRVACTILNSKTAYGRTDYLVMPCQGSGEQWVSGSRLARPETKA